MYVCIYPYLCIHTYNGFAITLVFTFETMCVLMFVRAQWHMSDDESVTHEQ